MADVPVPPADRLVPASSSPASPTALIVGAGIGGLAAAVALRRAGWRVRVFERAASPRELGFALLLAPNAIHALRALGIDSVVTRGGVVARAGEIRRPDGRVLKRFGATRAHEALGAPAVVVLRPVLHGALLDAVGPVALALGQAAEGVEQSDGGVTLHLEGGARVAGNVLVGGDGAGSAIRAALHPNEAPARQSGLVAVRGVAEGVVDLLGGVSGCQYFGRGVEAGLAQASATAVYWYLSLPSRLTAGALSPRDLVARAVAGFHAPFRAIIDATPDEALRVDELLVRDPLEQWGGGRVTLLGDAAHPMLPHAGQGAAQALEDAVVLGRALAGAADPAAALRRYEQARQPRTAAIAALARRNARAGALEHAVLCWLRDTAIRMAPQRLILKSIVDLGRAPVLDVCP